MRFGAFVKVIFYTYLECDLGEGCIAAELRPVYLFMILAFLEMGVQDLQFIVIQN